MLPKVLFVTGKGGTGKSTVAASLAVALARRHSTILADLDRRLTAANLVGANLDGRRSAQVEESLQAIALNPRGELESFIERIVPLRAVSRRMLQSRTFSYVTAALPGLEAFVLLEGLRAMADQAVLRGGSVVVDAPASGSAFEVLSVAVGIKGIAPLGTLNRLARKVEKFLADRTRFGVILTVTPEELALRELLETASTLRKRLGITVVAVVLNRVPEPLFETADLAAIGQLRGHAGLAVWRNALAERAAETGRRLREAALQSVELPMLFSPGVGKTEVQALSRHLETALLGR